MASPAACAITGQALDGLGSAAWCGFRPPAQHRRCSKELLSIPRPAAGAGGLAQPEAGRRPRKGELRARGFEQPPVSARWLAALSCPWKSRGIASFQNGTNVRLSPDRGALAPTMQLHRLWPGLDRRWPGAKAAKGGVRCFRFAPPTSTLRPFSNYGRALDHYPVLARWMCILQRQAGPGSPRNLPSTCHAPARTTPVVVAPGLVDAAVGLAFSRHGGLQAGEPMSLTSWPRSRGQTSTARIGFSPHHPRYQSRRGPPPRRCFGCACNSRLPSLITRPRKTLPGGIPDRAVSRAPFQLPTSLQPRLHGATQDPSRVRSNHRTRRHVGAARKRLAAPSRRNSQIGAVVIEGGAQLLTQLRRRAVQAQPGWRWPETRTCAVPGECGRLRGTARAVGHRVSQQSGRSARGADGPGVGEAGLAKRRPPRMIAVAGSGRWARWPKVTLWPAFGGGAAGFDGGAKTGAAFADST